MRGRTGVRRPWPVNTYLWSFIGLSVVLFLALAGATTYQLSELQRSIAGKDRQLAHDELAAAYRRAFATASQVAGRLAAHDEVRQQIANPKYYEYWLRERAHAIAKGPAWMDEIALYDADGRRLGSGLADDGELPETVAHASRDTLASGDHLHGEVVEPVDAVAIRDKRIHGFVAVSFDLREALADAGRFRYGDLDTLHFARDDDSPGRWTAARAMEHLQIAPLPNPESEAVSSLFYAGLVKFTALVLVLALVLYSGISVLLIRPIKRLSSFVDTLRTAPGAPVAPGEALPVSELDKMRASLSSYHEELSAAKARLEGKNQELWTLAHRDALTGFGNRRAFDEAMGQLASERLVGRVHLVLLDCNHFKAINDTYGHHVGDQLIRSTAERIQEMLRDDDVLYRIGGDEFACIFTHCPTETVRQISERCVNAVRASHPTELEAVERLSLSAGIGYLDPDETFNATLLHKRADMAMYRAKRPGDGSVVVWGPKASDAAEALTSHRLVSAVYRAIEEGDGLEMHYQLVEALDGRRDRYYEALARLRDQSGPIPPGQFFPVIESRGLESDFDIAVIQAVAEDLYRGRIPTGAGVSVNLSAQTVVRRDIRNLLSGLIAAKGNRKLVIEITETALVSRMDLARTNLERLREDGFEVALDDFGNGYSSFRYLASMPVDVVKFDIALIHALDKQDEVSRFIVDVTEMMQRAGYRLTAEGIETDSMLRRVRALGFDYAQGFLIGRPFRPEARARAVSGRGG